ncbi:MAG: 3-dehydroquinate synthase [Candidatus Omnitrophota bacterium]|jgi:3-dehydroquinate synthase
MTQVVRVPLKERSYGILIGHGLIGKAGAIIRNTAAGKDAVVITNKSIARLFGKKIKASLNRAGITFKLELVPDSEKAKSSDVLIPLLNRIGAYDKNRELFLIGLGGGVIGDLTGFAASIYKRGIPYIHIPTTLLAQVDSAIGGKTAIDLPIAKNLVGSFYQPKAVISDTSSLSSLSPRQIRSGLAECIKYAVIGDRKLFEYLEHNCKKALAHDAKVLGYIILSCARIKAGIVSKDEFDRKEKRIVLNLGHTIGHAIESASGYAKRYSHGESIAIGMACAACISSRMGLIREGDRQRIIALIKKCGLPTRLTGVKISRIYDSLLHDKKSIHGTNRFVIPTGIGKVRIVYGVGKALIIKSIKDCI